MTDRVETRSEHQPYRARILRRAAWVVAGCSFIAAMACYMSYRVDRATLHAVAENIIAGTSAPDERVLHMLHFVHRIQGTRKNPGAFLLPKLGATPRDVLEHGGDCADRSRLLCALLREVHISATPAMCFDAHTGLPNHTVVEAQLAAGVYMIVDPTYDLYFPAPDRQGYYDLLDLRRDPTIVARRVEELCKTNPPAQETDRYYLSAFTGYSQPSTYNWNRNVLLRFVRASLSTWFGDAVYRLPRLVIFEEPKLFVGGLSLLPGVIVLLALIRPGLGRRRAGVGSCQDYRTPARLALRTSRAADRDSSVEASCSEVAARGS
ncbi:MAG: transglutaminase-like domain-containing protein [Planctomycetes bacterium]|nr:transglutaminase-like domain-containing protein [Planctomycetota bacterium]